MQFSTEPKVGVAFREAVTQDPLLERQVSHSNLYRGFTVAVSCLYLAVILAACNHAAVNPGDLQRIVVSRTVGSDAETFDERNRSWQIAITSDGHYVFERAGNQKSGRLPFSVYTAQLKQMKSFPGFSSVPTDLGSYLFSFQGTDGVREAAVPTHGNDHRDLQLFAEQLHSGVLHDQGSRNAKVTKQLRVLNQLQAIALRSNGCFGNCAAYTFRVARDGHATIDWAYPTPHFQTSASIPWTDVTLVLKTAGVDELDRNYPSRAVDTLSARLDLRFTRFQYSVNAPDSFSWPPQFKAIVRGLELLIRRANWSPRLTEKAYNKL